MIKYDELLYLNVNHGFTRYQYSKVVSAHLTHMQTKNVLLHARLITTASDAHTTDIFYHTNYYTQLRYAASKVNHSADSASHGHAPPVFDSMVTSQLVLYMSESGKVFTRTHLESLYKDKLEELGRPCPDINATRFKDHLLSSLSTGWHSSPRVGMCSSVTQARLVRHSLSLLNSLK